MEFLDEETRPRLHFQSRFTSGPPLEPETQAINKPIAIISVITSLLVSLLSVFFLQSETLTFILLWFSLALLVGPFAPISITGGDIRVGQGEVIEEPPPSDLDPTLQFDDQFKKRGGRNNKFRNKPEEIKLNPLPPKIPNPTVVVDKEEEEIVMEEKEWTDVDFDLLKKQISKHPVGTARRWELIAEGFKGRHGVESVIKMAKSMGERKPGSGDSFSQFLKQRKPLDKRIEEDGNGEVKKETSFGEGEGGLCWSSAEDIALLNALKAFPKEVSMRWEKIAVAVPGRSKASCMKRVTELKKGFRSSKASAE